jgi:hypothetical protein
MAVLRAGRLRVRIRFPGNTDALLRILQSCELLQHIHYPVFYLKYDLSENLLVTLLVSGDRD